MYHSTSTTHIKTFQCEDFLLQINIIRLALTQCHVLCSILVAIPLCPVAKPNSIKLKWPSSIVRVRVLDIANN